ncbi:MAG: cupin-like domain-containing protein [Myxococcales bacterium]
MEAIVTVKLSALVDLANRLKNSTLKTLEGPARLLHRPRAPRTPDMVGDPLHPIDVRSKLSREEFVINYLSANRPVVVTDAMDRWDARHWTLASFERDFGDCAVTLQAPEFEGGEVSKVRDFIRQVRGYEHLPVELLPAPSEMPNARNLKGGYGQGFTSTAFERLAKHWERPYFVPVSGYVSPSQLLCLPNYQPHTQFGFYVSPRGAATSLHVDGGFSNALLGQIAGEKKVFLFSPDQTPRLPRHHERPPAHYLRGEQPGFGGEQPMEFTLRPGMMMFIPKYHWHEIYTLSASISITYTFVHASDVTRQWVRDISSTSMQQADYA